MKSQLKIGSKVHCFNFGYGEIVKDTEFNDWENTVLTRVKFLCGIETEVCEQHLRIISYAEFKQNF